MNRREFLKGTAWMSIAAAFGGCNSLKLGSSVGAPMANFAAPALERIRIGFVGVGSRGTFAVKRIALIPGVEIAALCDVNEEAIAKNEAFLKEKHLPAPRRFVGPEAYKNLCDWDGVDVIYACTPWELHVPVACAAMDGAKHAFVEVPAAMNVDECWRLVKKSEETRRHCMMLENCCYGENEMLALNMVRQGLFGDIVYGEAGYLHDCRYLFNDPDEWRLDWYAKHCGNIYPTHGLGPVAQYMNINRGDQFDYLVSMESPSLALPQYWKEKFPDDRRFDKWHIKSGDMNTALVKTMNGNTIFLGYTVNVPHPYSRMNTIQGTKGILTDFPLRIAFEDGKDRKVKREFDLKETEELKALYKHPMWKVAGEVAAKVGGHGGMDFIMDLRWIYCLQNGLPLDMDVYDLAAWSSIAELTEKSVLSRSEPIDIPDFTRGGWRTMKPLGIEMIDLKKMHLDDASLDTSSPQQTI